MNNEYVSLKNLALKTRPKNNYIMKKFIEWAILKIFCLLRLFVWPYQLCKALTRQV